MSKLLAANQLMEVVATNAAEEFTRPHIILHQYELPDPRATFAMSLIEKWGMVAAATNNGEDSAGRQKLELQEPDELVERAMSITSLAFDAFKSHGWLVEVPAWGSVEESLKAKEKVTP